MLDGSTLQGRAALDGSHGEAGNKNTGDTQKQHYTRKKENAQQRRERRLRAEARHFDKLVKACKAAAGHHTTASRLVGCIRMFLSNDWESRPTTVPGCNSTLTSPKYVGA